MFKDSNHANENFPKSQAIKDATMGYFIAQNFKPNSIFLHLNGSYHSDFFDGTVWYVNHYMPGKNIKSISVVEQNDVKTLDEEHYNKATFIVVVDKDMPTTY